MSNQLHLKVQISSKCHKIQQWNCLVHRNHSVLSRNPGLMLRWRGWVRSNLPRRLTRRFIGLWTCTIHGMFQGTEIQILCQFKLISTILRLWRRELLSYSLCQFITEIKKITGNEYPPKTIYEMIVCIQMHLESYRIFWKLLNNADKAFIQLCYTCNNLMKEKAAGGLGSCIK